MNRTGSIWLQLPPGGVVAARICIVNAAPLAKIKHEQLQPNRSYIEFNDQQMVTDIPDQIRATLLKNQHS